MMPLPQEPEEAPQDAPDSPAPLARTPPRRDRAAIMLAGAGFFISVVTLATVLDPPVPPLVQPAAAVMPVPLPADAPLPLIGIELLLPHLPRTAPFPRAFSLAFAFAAGDAEATALLAPLHAVAPHGAPGARQLADTFAESAEAALLAEMGLAPDAGWVARRAAATMRLGASLGSAGTPTLAAVQAASAALAAGDLPAAEAALEALPPAPAAALRPWREGLQRRLTADAAARRLSALALHRVALR